VKENICSFLFRFFHVKKHTKKYVDDCDSFFIPFYAVFKVGTPLLKGSLQFSKSGIAQSLPSLHHLLKTVLFEQSFRL